MWPQASSNKNPYNGIELVILSPAFWKKCPKHRAVCIAPHGKHFQPLGVYFCQVCYYHKARYWAVDTIDCRRTEDADRQSRQVFLLSETMFQQHFILLDDEPCKTSDSDAR